MLLRVVGGGLPLAVALAVMAVPTYAAGPRQILIHDECSPSFNAPVPAGAGPGTCANTGGVPFSQFVAQVTQLHQAPEWHFTPDHTALAPGEAFVATNVGGEVHSFTEVDAFGGGVVGFLNDLSGAGATRPECLNPATAQFLAPGASTAPDVPGGTELYQCCIHPWMHEVISVKS
jgi:hypothetical protein